MKKKKRITFFERDNAEEHRRITFTEKQKELDVKSII